MPEGRTPFEQIALLLQGGGALGAYQAGVYQALDEAGLRPDWVIYSEPQMVLLTAPLLPLPAP